MVYNDTETLECAIFYYKFEGEREGSKDNSNVRKTFI